ncbi:MAG TPA: hypothetical protein VFA32_00805 [Dehalococcoidia bacterium]|nr:hypothetical protein [Dehalococcoidia bacterium]
MPQETGLFWGPLDARARERLRALVGALKGNDPLAPVSVVVPSTYAGLDLRHDLGRHRSASVHLMVLPRLTELLGAPSLAAIEVSGPSLPCWRRQRSGRWPRKLTDL